jgi:hypothetical protein
MAANAAAREHARTRLISMVGITADVTVGRYAKYPAAYSAVSQ